MNHQGRHIMTRAGSYSRTGLLYCRPLLLLVTLFSFLDPIFFVGFFCIRTGDHHRSWFLLLVVLLQVVVSTSAVRAALAATTSSSTGEPPFPPPVSKKEQYAYARKVRIEQGHEVAAPLYRQLLLDEIYAGGRRRYGGVTYCRR